MQTNIASVNNLNKCKMFVDNIKIADYLTKF